MRTPLSIVHPASTSVVVAALALLAVPFGALAGCGSDTPLGGPYGGTTNPTPPNTENTSGPGNAGGSSSSGAGTE